MSVRINNAFRNKRADCSYRGATGVDFAGGTAQFRTGSQPANADAVATGTVVATVALASPAFGAAATGVSTAQGLPLQDASADNAGTIGWVRVTDSTGTYVMDLSASGPGGGGDVIVDNPVLAASQLFQIISWTMTEPNGV